MKQKSFAVVLCIIFLLIFSNVLSSYLVSAQTQKSSINSSSSRNIHKSKDKTKKKLNLIRKIIGKKNIQTKNSSKRKKNIVTRSASGAITTSPVSNSSASSSDRSATSVTSSNKKGNSQSNSNSNSTSFQNNNSSGNASVSSSPSNSSSNTASNQNSISNSSSSQSSILPLIQNTAATPDPIFEPAGLFCSVSQAPETPPSGAIKEGSVNVLFLTVNCQNGNRLVIIKHLAINGEHNSPNFPIENYIKSIRLESDLYGVIGTDNSFDGFSEFLDTRILITPRSSIKFRVYADINTGMNDPPMYYPTSVSLSFPNKETFGAYDILGRKVNLGNTSFPLSSNWQKILIKSEFMISDTAQPDDSFVSPGTFSVPMLNFQATSLREDFNLTDVFVSMEGQVSNISRLMLTDERGYVYAYSDPVSGNESSPYHFYTFALYVAKDTSKLFAIKADFSQNSAINTNNRLKLQRIRATGNKTGTEFLIEPVDITGNLVTISLSDLEPTRIFFDQDSVLNITIQNKGKIVIPENKGNFSLEIDGIIYDGYLLKDLPDQTFRQPGGSSTLRTDYRLAGSNRQIKVTLDTLNEIRELDELNNTLAATLTAPPQTGPDFVISDITRGRNDELVILVKNAGNANSNENEQISAKVFIDGRFVANYNTTMPSLPVGETGIIVPNPYLVYWKSVKVKVVIKTDDVLDEIDNTNNFKEELLADAQLTTKAKLARFLVNIAKIPVKTEQGPHYTDVPKVHPDYDVIETATNLGIMGTTGENMFKPDDLLTRGYLSEIVLKTFSVPTLILYGSSYTDVPAGHTAYPYIETLVSYLGFSNNSSYTNYHPDDLADDHFSKSTLDIMERILMNLKVQVNDTLPENQTVSQGGSYILSSLDITALRHLSLFTTLEINANSAFGNNHVDVSDIVENISLMIGNEKIAEGTFKYGFIKFDKLNISIPADSTLRVNIVGKIKSDAPLGAKFQIQIRKNSVTSPSGVLIRDNYTDYQVNNLINSPEYVRFSTYSFNGPINEVFK